MKKTTKVLSLVCALAMIFSMFSAFTIAKADAAMSIVAELEGDSTKAGDTVTINLKVNGMTTAKGIQFYMPIDSRLEYVDGTVDASLGGLPVKNLDGDTFKYAWVAMASTPVTEGQKIGSVVFNIKDSSAPIELELTAVKLTDGDGVAYTVDANQAFADKIVVDSNVVDEPTKYSVTVNAGENGTATADVAEAAEGDTVTITATANEGYKVKEIKVNGTAIEGNTFTMPAEAVTVDVTFEEDEADKPEKPSKQYTIEAKTATKDLGKEYTLDITENEGYEGTKNDKFDVVVQAFDSKGVSIGYMVFADVTVDSDISFYLTKGSEATILVVDDCTGADINNSDIIANKIEKK